jgi:hypothetical protein
MDAGSLIQFAVEALSQHSPAAEMLSGAWLPAMGQNRTNASQHVGSEDPDKSRASPCMQGAVATAWFDDP